MTSSKVPSIPDDLLERLIEGKVVLFVGSGLSLAAGAPSWTELLQGLADEAKRQHRDLSDGSDLDAILDGPAQDKILAAGYLKQKLGVYYGKVISRMFGNLEPVEAHTEIARLRLHAVVTTNFDLLIESVLPKLTVVHPGSHWDPEEPGHLIKLHGSCKPDPLKVVVAPDDYEHVLADKVLMANMSHLYRNYTFLFVGFGLSDPDTVATLEPLRALFGDHTRHHYALVNEDEVGPIRRSALEQQLRVIALRYRTDDDHREVVTFLSKLADAGAKITDRWGLLITHEEASSRSTKLLVKDGSEGWRFKGVLPYMLPNLPYSDDLDAARAGAAKQLGVAKEDITLTPHGELFRTRNKKPSSDRPAVYRFRFARVRFINPPADPVAHFSTVGARPARFITLSEARNHLATCSTNGDVYKRLSDEFGSDLENL